MDSIELHALISRNHTVLPINVKMVNLQARYIAYRLAEKKKKKCSILQKEERTFQRRKMTNKQLSQQKWRKIEEGEERERREREREGNVKCYGVIPKF